MRKPARPLALFAATALAAVAGAAGAGAAPSAPPPPYTTVAQIETLILNSDFATNNGITDADCVGLLHPTPKRNAQGVRTFHRFQCHLSGVYFDTTAVVVFTGHGQFNVTGA